MTNAPAEMFMDAWKQQVGVSLRIVEALVEGATRMHEAQIEAATEAHASAEAARQSLASAKDPAELLRIQSEWVLGNLRKSADYWRCLCEVANETGSDLSKCMSESTRKKA